jgi:DNA topoisomerase-1
LSGNPKATREKRPRRPAAEAVSAADPKEAAESVGLIYVTDQQPGFSRRRAGDKFKYIGTDGRRITDKKVLERVRKLAVPPAYSDVWICPAPNGHLQATGRDAKGRKQYRYHEKFREVRDGTKYGHMLEFAAALPAIRSRISHDMAARRLSRETVLATIVHLLETTMIRVGNEDYAKQNQSYGLTTLANRHVEVAGTEVKFSFKGKSGKQWRLTVKDRRVAKVIRQSQDLPGEHLFQYLDEDGEQRDITSGDVNTYLKEISGRNITAKDFRTWTGTVLAAMALTELQQFDSQTAAKRNIRNAIERVAARLGNTVTICRKCYVHPEILDSYLTKELVLETRKEIVHALADDIASLRPEEALVLAFLERRLSAKRAMA